MMAMKPVVLITGSSRGIGAAVALLAAQAGWAVAVNYVRQADKAQALVDQIKAQGGQAVALQADIGVASDIARLFADVDRLFANIGPLRGLVNNAGIVDRVERVDEMSFERVERMMRINVVSAFMCSQAAVLRMSTRHGGEGGSIVNLGSAASRLGGAGQYVDYAASKGAIDSFTIGLSKEVAAERVRVNCVRPGIIDTDIHASGGLPNRVRDVGGQMPMGRVGMAQEVALAVVWFLSEHSSYCSGSILDVSGAR
jgi:NAD(P)-dependent dehydrogenase (short-subunit alcohol dehydrogenase family)